MKKYFLPLVLFIVGLVVIVFPHMAQRVNKEIHENQVEAIQEQINEMPEEKKKEVSTEVKDCNEAIFNNEDAFNDPFTENYDPKYYESCAKVIEKDEFPLALEVPKLDLNIPIFIGASQENLAKGIAQVEGSSLPTGGESTHTVLSGHRGMGTKAMFRHLDHLDIGDVFYIHTLEETLTYHVYDTNVILPHETESLMIQEGKDLASLFACHPYRNNTHRLVVYAERVHE